MNIIKKEIKLEASYLNELKKYALKSQGLYSALTMASNMKSFPSNKIDELLDSFIENESEAEAYRQTILQKYKPKDKKIVHFSIDLLNELLIMCCEDNNVSA